MVDPIANGTDAEIPVLTVGASPATPNPRGGTGLGSSSW
jgi:hypothetical protein